MAKNAQEIADLKQQVTDFMDANPTAGWDSDFGRIPVNDGDVLTFMGDVELQHSTTAGVPDWLAFKTVEGHPIGLRQLFRRGNGLTYPADCTTPKKAAAKFIEKCASFENGLQLTVKEVRKVESSSRKGKNTYYIFGPFTFD